VQQSCCPCTYISLPPYHQSASIPLPHISLRVCTYSVNAYCTLTIAPISKPWLNSCVRTSAGTSTPTTPQDLYPPCTLIPEQKLASKEGWPEGPVGAETLKEYRHVAALQMLEKLVTSQIQGIAAADAPEASRARAEMLERMLLQ